MRLSHILQCTIQNKSVHISALWDMGQVHCEICSKGIKNGCPCIVEIRGMQGCALVADPARAIGEWRDVAKAQP